MSNVIHALEVQWKWYSTSTIYDEIWKMKNEKSPKKQNWNINKKSKTMNFYEFSKRKQKMQKQNITSKYEKQGNHPS